MTTVELRTNILPPPAEYTRSLDDEAEMPVFAADDLIACRALLQAAKYRESGSYTVIERADGADFSVRALVQKLTGGNRANLGELEDRAAVAAPNIAFDEQTGALTQREGITIYVRDDVEEDEADSAQE